MSIRCACATGLANGVLYPNTPSVLCADRSFTVTSKTTSELELETALGTVRIDVKEYFFQTMLELNLLAIS